MTSEVGTSPGADVPVKRSNSLSNEGSLPQPAGTSKRSRATAAGASAQCALEAKPTLQSQVSQQKRRRGTRAVYTMDAA